MRAPDHIRRGTRPGEGLRIDAEHLARRTRRSRDEIVSINRQQRGADARFSGRQQDGYLRKCDAKFSTSIARAASKTAVAISLAKPSVRSARHEETSSAAPRSPRSS